MIWPFRKKEPPPAPDPSTPFANLIDEMAEAGWPPRVIAGAIRWLETKEWVLQLQAHAAANLAAGRVHKPLHKPLPKPRPVRPLSTPVRHKRRQEKWARQKRNQRARLKLVHPTNGGDAA